jgi:hypothetical protein
MDLISVATKNPDIGEQIKALSWKIQAEGVSFKGTIKKIPFFFVGCTGSGCSIS